jgi:hypothetical protein
MPQETDTQTEHAPLQLTPPEPVPPVSTKQADGAIRLEPAEVSDLQAKIEAFVNEIVETPANTEAFQDKVSRAMSQAERCLVSLPATLLARS